MRLRTFLSVALIAAPARAFRLPPHAHFSRKTTTAMATPKAAIEAQITSFSNDMMLDMNTAGNFEQWQAYWRDENCVMIRPSGNPLTQQGWKEMMAGGDIVSTKHELLSIDSVDLIAGAQAAFATFTTFSAFTYKGTPNEDIAKFTAVLEFYEEKWKFCHMHRGTGQKPEAK